MRNFAEPRVGSRRSFDEMETPVALSDGGVSPWGLGLEAGQHAGLRTAGHGGGDRGIATYVIRYRERGLAVAVLCNLDNIGASAGALARQVASVYLPELSAQPAEPAAAGPTRVVLTPEELAGKTGLYRDAATGTHGRVFVRDRTLWASADAGDGPGDSVELTPLGKDRFVIAHTPIVMEFIPGADGRPREIRATGMGPKPLTSERVEEGFTPTPSALQAFAGRYANADLDVVYSLETADSGLVLRIPGRADITLQPILPDAFYGSLVDLIRFSRDPRTDRVTGFAINRHSVRNLSFARVP